ncbi:unnamed protein product [Schistosoma mattheei]|uniref:Uncharacterized protein n=1 Tax=Schistosoma mattheei TaxID=31246 RepID=A0A183PBN4_9TREM|nr:unnamed protein product [Schistosoma mattheei]
MNGFTIDAILGNQIVQHNNLTLNNTQMINDNHTEQINTLYQNSTMNTNINVNNKSSNRITTFESIQTILPEYTFNERLNYSELSEQDKNNNCNNSIIQNDDNIVYSSKIYKNRSPRIPFSRDQIFGLERKFQNSKYLSGWEVKQLAKNLSLTETRVSNFINLFDDMIKIQMYIYLKD